jgi:hypothetical protein
MFELGETIFRLVSIVDEMLDESALFVILKTTPHIGIQKAVFALLQFCYENFICTRIKSESEDGNPLPWEAIGFIEQIPNVT